MIVLGTKVKTKQLRVLIQILAARVGADKDQPRQPIVSISPDDYDVYVPHAVIPFDTIQECRGFVVGLVEAIEANGDISSIRPSELQQWISEDNEMFEQWMLKALSV